MATQTSLKWTADGDQKVAQGKMGEYRITSWVIQGEDLFALRIFPKRIEAGTKTIGEFSSLANAKEAAMGYENYRASR